MRMMKETETKRTEVLEKLLSGSCSFGPPHVSSHAPSEPCHRPSHPRPPKLSPAVAHVDVGEEGGPVEGPDEADEEGPRLVPLGVQVEEAGGAEDALLLVGEPARGGLEDEAQELLALARLLLDLLHGGLPLPAPRRLHVLAKGRLVKVGLGWGGEGYEYE